MKERIKTVRFPVFVGYEVKIVITDDVVKSRKLRDKILGEPYQYFETAHAMHAWPLDGQGISWLFFKPDVEAGTIAHECWHCVRRLMKWLGSELENEIVAYHLAYLVQAVTNHAHKRSAR